MKWDILSKWGGVYVIQGVNKNPSAKNKTEVSIQGNEEWKLLSDMFILCQVFTGG
jgi:hypothetical protein